MTTTRKFLKQKDLEIGFEYGIEWGVPNGSLLVHEKKDDKYCVTLETYYDGELHYFTGNAKEINNWMKEF